MRLSLFYLSLHFTVVQRATEVVQNYFVRVQCISFGDGFNDLGVIVSSL